MNHHHYLFEKYRGRKEDTSPLPWPGAYRYWDDRTEIGLITDFPIFMQAELVRYRDAVAGIVGYCVLNLLALAIIIFVL